MQLFWRKSCSFRLNAISLPALASCDLILCLAFGLLLCALCYVIALCLVSIALCLVSCLVIVLCALSFVLSSNHPNSAPFSPSPSLYYSRSSPTSHSRIAELANSKLSIGHKKSYQFKQQNCFLLAEIEREGRNWTINDFCNVMDRNR